MRTAPARVIAVWLLIASQLHAEERIDLAAIQRIRQEAAANSKVMDTLFYLTDVHGPRLTNSSGFFRAAEFVQRLPGFLRQNPVVAKFSLAGATNNPACSGAKRESARPEVT